MDRDSLMDIIMCVPDVDCVYKHTTREYLVYYSEDEGVRLFGAGDTPEEALKAWVDQHSHLSVSTDILAVRSYNEKATSRQINDEAGMYTVLVHITERDGRYYASPYANDELGKYGKSPQEAMRACVNYLCKHYAPLQIQVFKSLHDYPVRA